MAVVLIVDDNLPTRQLLRLVFELDGQFDVREAEDAAAGRDHIATAPADLVIVDLIDDALSVIGAARRVRPDCRVVVYSAWPERVVKMRALDAGADVYLQKGLHPDIVATVTAVLGEPSTWTSSV